jgi:hypothetical protein
LPAISAGWRWDCSGEVNLPSTRQITYLFREEESCLEKRRLSLFATGTVAYVKIVNRINATIELALAKTGVEKFVKQLNEEIRYYGNVLAIRKGRKLAEEKEGPPKSR